MHRYAKIHPFSYAAERVAYAGDSRIVDPLGTVLAEASQIETVLTADVDPARVAQVRRDLPFLLDRTRLGSG